MDHEEYIQKKWERDNLSASSIEFLCNLPTRTNIIINNKKIAVMHYAMNENNNFANIIKSPSKDDLLSLFSGVESDIILFGHDHNQTIQKVNNTLYINFGSVGCPSASKNIAKAGILSFINEEISVIPVCVSYNVQKVFNDMEKFDFPYYELIKRYFFGVKK